MDAESSKVRVNGIEIISLGEAQPKRDSEPAPTVVAPLKSVTRGEKRSIEKDNE